MRSRLFKRAARILPFTQTRRIRGSICAGSVLDVGCGKGTAAETVAEVFSWLIGIDIFEPYLREAKKKCIYSDLVQGDIRLLPFKSKSFDIVLCLEVLEHMEKADARVLIKELERIARQRVIICSPVGYVPQDKYNGNPYQVHRSRWFPWDLRMLGYKISPVDFRYPALRHEESLFRTLLRQILTLSLYPIMKVSPEKCSGRMYCVKNLLHAESKRTAGL